MITNPLRSVGRSYFELVNNDLKIQFGLTKFEPQITCKNFEINDLVLSSTFRIDEIHQQLEEQLAVLARFIDGVANLRPKGLYCFQTLNL